MKVIIVIFNSLIMLHCWLASLINSIGKLKLKDLIEFYKLWYRVDKHRNEIFYYLEVKCFFLSFDAILQILFKIKYKTAFQILQISKKLKNIDNSLVLENTQITSFQDLWLIARRKIMPKIKAQIKKTATTKK